jgi:hypothetical protein
MHDWHDTVGFISRRDHPAPLFIVFRSAGIRLRREQSFSTTLAAV